MSDEDRRQEAEDERHMRRALALAARGWGQTAPNPMVGAVVVRDGVAVGEGYHVRFGEAHAEAVALGDAGAKARGSTVYVTLEPCAHHGKTPPCVDALIAAGVRRVVAAVADPNPVASGGAARLRGAGIEITLGVLEGEARELNAPFMNAFASDRPWVTLKLATSLDGALADHTRRPGWLTGEGARREVHRLRAGSDAIGVGLGTVLADDPALTVREFRAPRVAPARIVLSRSGRLPITATLARTAHEVPVLVVAEALDPAYQVGLGELGVDVLQASALQEALRLLRQRGIRSLLVEGGARIAGALLADSLVDRLIIFQAPVILGAGALGAFSAAPPERAGDARRMRIVARKAIGDDLMTTYAVDDR